MGIGTIRSAIWNTEEVYQIDEEAYNKLEASEWEDYDISNSDLAKINEHMGFEWFKLSNTHEYYFYTTQLEGKWYLIIHELGGYTWYCEISR